MVSNGSNLHKEKKLAESNAFYQMSRLKQICQNILKERLSNNV